MSHKDYLSDVRWKQVVWNSAEYALTVALRYQLLRMGLGLYFSAGELESEHDAVHLAGFNDLGQVVACLFMVLPVGTAHAETEGPGTSEGIPHVRLRQVCVREDCQGQGLGRALVDFAEQYLRRETSICKVVLHARQTVVPFYSGLNYFPEGDPFEEVGILHQRMAKSILTSMP